MYDTLVVCPICGEEYWTNGFADCPYCRDALEALLEPAPEPRLGDFDDE